MSVPVGDFPKCFCWQNQLRGCHGEFVYWKRKPLHVHSAVCDSNQTFGPDQLERSWNVARKALDCYAILVRIRCEPIYELLWGIRIIQSSLFCFMLDLCVHWIFLIITYFLFHFLLTIILWWYAALLAYFHSDIKFYIY